MPQVIPISDPDDPRVSAYLAVRERDLVGRQDQFIAEGEVVLRLALARAPGRIESLFLTKARLDALGSVTASLGDGVPVYVAPADVMSRVVGFAIHRGVLAVGRRAPEPPAAALLGGASPPDLVLGLVGIANHDNVGGLYRNAAAFGVGAVLRDRATCDPLYRKAIRVSVGASLVLPSARVEDAAEMIAVLHASGFRVLALAPAGAEPLSAIGCAPRTALLVGSEGAGLPAKILARTPTIRIPMSAGFDSLNVATASGIALHHLTSSPVT